MKTLKSCCISSEYRQEPHRFGEAKKLIFFCHIGKIENLLFERTQWRNKKKSKFLVSP
jgi:hypothetical protein